jgi:tRNA threonylcarbamoyladenosine dehydratase
MSSSSSSKPTNAALPSILVGFAAGCVTILTAQWILGRRRRSKDDNDETNGRSDGVSTSSSSSIPPKPALSLTPLMRREQLSRHYLYFGESGMENLRTARILIVGVGGVGSHAAHMLARAGIGRLQLIDYDQLTLSSLNRHACGVLTDVGRPKVEILANFLRQICPNEQYLKVDTANVMYTADAAGAALLELEDNDDGTANIGKNGRGCYYDMVLDCIDDIPTKAALVADCLQRSIPIISCMSAGGKADPTRLLLTDLRSAAKDPLATKLRLTLQQQHHMEKLTIVYSSEKTVMKLADLTDEQQQMVTAAASSSSSGGNNSLQQFGAVDGMRIRIVPVQGTMPAIMGQAMAAYCLNRLTTMNATTTAGENPAKMQPATVEKLGKSTRHKLYQHFQNRERKLYETARAMIEAKIQKVDEQNEAMGEYVTFPRPKERVVVADGANHDTESTTTTWWVGTTVQTNITDDLEYLLEIWRNRCCITGHRIGTTLHLVRWDLSRPSTVDNIILIGDKENALARFDDDTEAFKAAMDPIVRRSIEARLLQARVHGL